MLNLKQFLGYGKCGEDVTRHTSTHICHEQSQLDKLIAKATFVSENEFVDESGDVKGYEVRMNKTQITDSKPVHIATAILQWSKILFIK